MATATQILNAEVAQRVEGYRYDLLDKHNAKIGEVYPTRTPSMSNDSSQGVVRRLSNFKLTPTDTAAINVLSDRVQAWMLVGSAGTPYSLGIFLWAQQLVRRMRHGLVGEGALGDQGIILAQPLIASRTITAGSLVTDAMRALFDEAGVYDVDIDASTATVGSPMTYQGGQPSITYITVLNDLANMAGFLTPYFLTSGRGRVRLAPDLTTIDPTLTYNAGTRIYNESVTVENNLLTAPNRYRAVGTSATTAEIAGDYVLPSTYPHSYAERGFYITKRIESSGIANNDDARAYAESYALQDPKAYETITFTSPWDPRHETLDPLTVLGNTYLELSYGGPLTAGGPMSHKAKRLFLT